MTRLAALCASLCLLTACAGSSTPPILTETRLACPPSLRADLPPAPRLPEGAGMVAPAGTVEGWAYQLLLTGADRLRDYAEAMATRATTAKRWCDGQAK
jgi:hypothetical protein